MKTANYNNTRFTLSQPFCTDLIVQALIISLPLVMAWPPPPLHSLCTTIFTSMSPSLALSRTSLIYRFSVGSSFALAASVSFVSNAGWSALGARAATREQSRGRGSQPKEARDPKEKEEGLKTGGGKWTEEQVLSYRDNLRISESQSAARK